MRTEPLTFDEIDIQESHCRKAARRIHQEEGLLEVDHDAKVSLSPDQGAWVQTWVWVWVGAEDVRPEDRE